MRVPSLTLLLSEDFFRFILIKYELESYPLFLKVKNGFLRFESEDNLPTKPTLVTHMLPYKIFVFINLFFIKQVYRYYITIWSCFSTFQQWPNVTCDRFHNGMVLCYQNGFLKNYQVHANTFHKLSILKQKSSILGQ